MWETRLPLREHGHLSACQGKDTKEEVRDIEKIINKGHIFHMSHQN